MQFRARAAVVPFALILAGLAPAQSGALDPTFGTNGVVVNDFLGAGSATYTGWGAARNPASGEIVVAAGLIGTEGHEQWTVMRFRADGTRDTGFGVQGSVRSDFQPFGADPDHPSDVAFDNSGAPGAQRILVTGTARVPDPSNFGAPTPMLAVVAYLPDGALDASFADNGVFLLAGLVSAQGFGIDALPDGKALVTGARDSDYVVLRLMHDGTLDAGFGSGGIASVPTNGSSPSAAAVQPDGGIVIGMQGYSYFPEFSYEASLTRLTPAGALDLGFGSGGTLALSGELLAGLVARGDGTLVTLLAPVIWTDPYSLRLFAADGSSVVADTLLSADFGPSSLDVAADDSVVLGGTLATDSNAFAVARTTSALALDTAFDTDGYATLDFGGYQSNTHALAAPGGELVVVGVRNDPIEFDASFIAGKLLHDGSPDPTFAGGAGFETFAILASTQDLGQDLAVHQADGKIVALARTIGGAGAAVVVRYLPDGTLDAGFGEDGVRPLHEPALAGLTPIGIGLQSGGRIVVTGLRFAFLPVPPFSQWDLVAVGLDASGALDPTFGGDGVGELSLAVQYAFGGGIAVQPDDKIVVCTTAYVTFPSSEMAVARFAADGSIDAGFGAGGVAWVASPGHSLTATSVAVAADGRIAVGGHDEAPYPEYAVEVALAWVGSGGALLAGPGTSVPGFGVDVAVDGSGRAVVAAQRYWGTPIYDEFFNLIGIVGESPWPSTHFAAVRVLPSGLTDAGFGAGGVAHMAVPTADHAYATTLAVQPDGRIVLAGSATIQPTPGEYANDILVLRLLTSGAPDASFSGDGATNIDVGPNDVPQSILVQGDGKLVAVGTALAYGSGQKSDLVVLRILGADASSPDVLIEALIADVLGMVQSQQLKHGNGKALTAKLQAALAQVEKQNFGPAANQIGAFKNQVEAMVQAKHLSAALAAPLLADADAILALLVGP